MTAALYRRYRPDSFDEVIGQEHVTVPLMQALRTNRVNHAYLFSGPRGCGKTTSARILARILNCAQNTPETPRDSPCGECDSCRDLARGGAGSLDVVEIDAASHGGVDDARELRERATFSPTRDRFKIFILDEAHMVTPQGFNALLKIVEEPPEYLKFIFATTEPDKVIGTIRSRTHHYPFRLVPPEVLEPYLEQLCVAEGVTIGAGVLPLVVRAGAGSVRDSLSVMDQLIAGSQGGEVDYELAVSLLGYTHAALLDDVVEALAARDGASIFRVIERIINTGHEPRRFVEDLLERLRDLIVITVSGDGAESVLRSVPADQMVRLRAQAGNLGFGELSRAADLVNDALTEMSGATSPRLHLELLSARLLLPGADDGTGGLLARVERLERLGHAGTLPAPESLREEGDRAGAPSGTGASGRDVRGSGADDAGSGGSALSGIEAARAAAARATSSASRVRSEARSEARDRREAAGLPARDEAPVATGGAVAPAEAKEHAPETTVEPERARLSEPAPAPKPAAAPAPEPAAPAPELGPERPGAMAPEPPDEESPAVSEAGLPVDSERQPSGALDTEVLRRRWPEVLDTVSRLKRTTWALVGPNSQVARLTDTTLQLVFSSPGLATTFRNGPHADIVHRALVETLGVDVRVEGTIAEEGAPAVAATSEAGPGSGPARRELRPDGPGRTAPAPPPTARPGGAGREHRGAPRSGGESHGAKGQPAADADADRAINPADVTWEVAPLGGAPSSTSEPTRGASSTDASQPVPAADSSSAATAVARARAHVHGPTAPAVVTRATPYDDVPPFDDEPSMDDPDSVPFSESTLTGPALVAQLLGGQVVDEIVDEPGR
ncbi:MAG: DNA polymerase III subunit gamma and tau [Cellulomonadaceae bacterium]